MSETISDLYLKFADEVGRSLEDDRYFLYLYEMVQAGDNTIEQSNQILKKVVDEQWLNVIEESLTAINNIIEKPRRFITTEEEVVPVSLAKKITADSVRHLSMNTQFIASDENGDIQPTRILNVSNVESYDLYENRFIYHLIQRLITFVDKRTDVIFWQTGDEHRTTMKLESKIDDAYEEIEYKLEMTIKNRQSYADNDADNMEVFMRIDRVRRLVLALRGSSFCSIMAGCSKVRSPIQRTNLIMKDPDYRTCYKLWQFLESYDDVGYTIDVQNEPLAIDEEYLIQMYTNLISNYTVFKSLQEFDSRDLEQAEENVKAEPRELLKPKFVKKIQEEFVDDYNIEEVEIRKVFVEEVTQAQLDAEERLAHEIRISKQAQEDRDAAEASLQETFFKLNSALEIKAVLEDEVQSLRGECDALAASVTSLEEQVKTLQEELASANRQAERARERAVEKVAQAKAEADQKIQEITDWANQRVSRSEQDAKEQIAKAQAKATDAISKTKTEAAEQVRAAKDAADLRVEQADKAAREQIAQAKSEAEEQAAAARKEAKAQVAAARQESMDAQVAARIQTEIMEQKCKEQVESIRREMEALRKANAETVAKVQAEADARVASVQAEADSQIEQIVGEAERRIRDVQSAANLKVNKQLRKKPAPTRNNRRH
ncbi:MAG: DUF2357 domain-containing protein [Lachnospiraceae bacterium]|nr:DUF2357 domain-containing protein [Lachnospiraceae bacterium]